ncbi:DUF1934 family protein [Ferroacidibacillus organovorans]|uniref:DUF1934 domain-containing protein n=1 Tax=Ferroacidibacillus organovorans TaxID=1765683 RepID=A0A162TYU5_9BACL|nr:DUF1934 family protein [Ferroacidibacillus organovorans]KYP81255.1 hypothetical protein AYJ22_08020 [Ferroacidibacillus organovorans]OAG93763.1 hypothetical protein AYW79_08955 [Ferroacidibacillus organovorans]OPG16830.1 hypothetical protein B2M26_04285 [Ferroacidibacillus organovorans]
MERERAGTIRIVSGELDTKAPARIRMRGSLYQASYHEPEENFAQTETTVTFSLTRRPFIRVERVGGVRASYDFELEQTTDGFYDFPEGKIELRVYTSTLAVFVTNQGIQAEIVASMVMHGVDEHPLTIAIELDFEP